MARWRVLTRLGDAPPESRRAYVRKRTGALVVDGVFRSLPRVGRLFPASRPDRHAVEVLRDVPYRDGGLREHTLDVYRPAVRTGPLPVVLYVHGGGFRMLSKDSHWLMGLAYARRGFVVFNISYRLAPRHKFPAAVEDAAAALAWVWQHAADYGGDRDRLVLAGESAGGNLVTTLAICTSWRRPEPFAARLFDLGVRPRAVCALYGMLQVTDTARFRRRKALPWWIQDRLDEVAEAYLPTEAPACGWDLADPLVVLERPDTPDRPLPPFFAPVGTADPLLDDTRRLGAALTARGVPADVRFYPGEIHAFHVFLWRPAARACWQDMGRFLERHVGAGAGPGPAPLPPEPATGPQRSDTTTS